MTESLSMTMADLARAGRLEGRRVRLLEDVGSFVAKGAVGLVIAVRSCEPRATVRYLAVRPSGARRSVPWAYQDVESPFCKLQLVGGDEDPR